MLARNTRDRQLQEVFALASKMATLEAKMDINELETSDEYAALEERFTELRETVDIGDPEDDLYADLTTRKIRTVFDSN